MALNAAAKSLLLAIVAFGDVGGYVKTGPALNSLKKAGFVDQHPTFVDPEGKVAVKVTDAGKVSAVAVPLSDAVKQSFTLVSNVPVPAGRKGGNKGKSIYPFETMVVGQSFFIPATAEQPEPWKSLASTATSATRRYDELVVENGVAVMETVRAKARKAKGVEGLAGYKPAVPAHQEERQKVRHTRTFVMRGPIEGTPYGAPGVQGAACFRTA